MTSPRLVLATVENIRDFRTREVMRKLLDNLGTAAFSNDYNDLINAPAAYTDEKAQDAVGTILTDTDTIDFTYNDGTPSIVADVKKQMSIVSDSSGLKLSGDSSTPGNNKVYGTDGSGTKGWKADPTSGGGGVSGQNEIINGSGVINQRADTSAQADDTYGHDGWFRLTESNAIAVSDLADVEDGTPSMMRLTQSNASAQRIGYAQIIEGKKCKYMRGKQVTLKFGRLRLSSSANIRMALLEWTGTEDAVTSDVVNNWSSGTYTAGNFFLGSNLTITNVTQQALTANTLTDGTEINVTLGSSFNNLIVFIWTESTVAQNVTLDIAKVKLEKSATATEYIPRSIEEELAICQRYLPAFRDNVTDKSIGVSGQCFSSTQALITWPFFVAPRIKPTGITVSGQTHFAATTASSTRQATTAIALNYASLKGATLQITVGSGLSVGFGTTFWTANSAPWILFTGCEL